MKSKRIICPICGNDLGPKQKQSTLTGCRRCRVWVNNAGELVKDPNEHFKAWQQRKEQLKADGRTSEGRFEERVIAK